LKRSTRKDFSEKQDIKVRVWRNLQEHFALAMLRNFIFLLEERTPKLKEIQEVYLRRFRWQKEIIFKKIRNQKRKCDIRKTMKMIWKTTGNILKWAIESQLYKWIGNYYEYWNI
jgi:uncharacterized protein with von Willebrand factor type A (vWA) domain